jgi:hypothetical protein
MIKFLGNFRELQPVDDDGDSLSEARGAMSVDDAEQIAAYLGAGASIATTGMLVDDVLDPTNTGIAAEEVVTDGTWVWPGALAYYVGRYRVRLPDEFVAAVKAQRGVPPTLTDADLDRVQREMLGA